MGGSWLCDPENVTDMGAAHRCSITQVSTPHGSPLSLQEKDGAAASSCAGPNVACNTAQVLCQSQVAPGMSLLASLVGARGDDFVPTLHPPVGVHDRVGLPHE